MRFLLPILFLAGTPAFALELEIPIDCTPGKNCFVQNYVDMDPGPGWKDFKCGPLSYDKHSGVDFRLLNYVDMEKGVNVLAAAPGIVRGVRDEMEDVSVRDIGTEAVKNRECGNGVVIAHDGGYETQYCHMRHGSIAVTEGQSVKAGDPLGKVGLSGLTEFPHAHLTVRKADGTVIDPFTGTAMGGGCGTERHPLWSKKALAQLDYIPTGLLGAGFADTQPTEKAISYGKYSQTTLPANSPMLIFWAQVFGILKDDVVTITLKYPDGTILAQHTAPAFDRSKAQFFNFVGKKLTTGSWPKGVYTGDYVIMRQGKEALRTSERLEVR